MSTTISSLSALQRPYTGEADLVLIANLVNACEAVDQLGGGTSVEELRQQFADPSSDPYQNVQLWQAPAGELLACANLWVPPANETELSGFLNLAVHPEARDRGLESQLLAWGETRLRQIGQTMNAPLRLRAGCRNNRPDRIALLEGHGFRLDRTFYRMARSLTESIPTAPPPPGFVVRELHPSEVMAWVDLFNQSFQDHWNHHDMTLESRQHWMDSPDYQADLDLVAVAPDGRFAALCWGFIHPADNARQGCKEGWIGDLGTHPDYRRMGLGRALLVAGMERLRQAGMETALLSVDTQNVNQALHLYESVGFQQRYAILNYVRELGSISYL